MQRRVLMAGGLAALVGLSALAQAPEDPVVKARAQRAAAQGVSEGDLPPVPRGIVEPPPLPPPEAHVKDARKGKKAKAAKKGKAAPKKGKSAAAKKPAKKKAP